jgi:hypothetical protein
MGDCERCAVVRPMKLYTITRIPGGKLELRAEKLVVDKDKNGRSIGSHVETEITSTGYDTGNNSPETLALALAITRHYYGATGNDPGAEAEAIRKAAPFGYAFLFHHALSPGAQLEISSDVVDRWNSLL